MAETATSPAMIAASPLGLASAPHAVCQRIRLYAVRPRLLNRDVALSLEQWIAFTISDHAVQEEVRANLQE